MEERGMEERGREERSSSLEERLCSASRVTRVSLPHNVLPNVDVFTNPFSPVHRQRMVQ